MRIAICDDGQELERLSGMLKEYRLSRRGSLECCFFHNETDFLCDVKGGEYDFVLLDGMQAARELRELDKNVKIIFLSALAEGAVESYRSEAYDYLNKPVDSGSLFALLDKMERELLLEREQGFVLKNRKGVARVLFSAVEYVEVVNKTVSFHLADGAVFEVTATFSDFEEKFLPKQEFLKPHRSYLANLNYVQAIGSDCIVMKSGHHIPVSRRRRNQVQDAYMHFVHQAAQGFMMPDARTIEVSEKPGRPDGPWRILLVDDDAVERTFWADILKRHGCIVQTAGNGGDALKMAAEECYDCVLLDVMIPGESGFSICERFRTVMVHTPVIFLSCLTESDKQVEGFAAGGIDYITKNTPPELFWAKVETRIKLSVSGRTQFRYGPLLLDLTKHRALMNEKELPLTSTEFEILWRLSEHSEHVFTPEEIFDMVWGGQPWDDGQMVQMHMSRLRRKLEEAWEGHHFIETVWGRGYCFAPGSN